MAGRPSKFTPAIADALLTGIRKGIPERQILQQHQVSDGALRRWLGAGGQGRQPYVDFLRRYRAARAKAERGRTLLEVQRGDLIVTVRRARGYVRGSTAHKDR
jgi:hypothetical protein